MLTDLRAMAAIAHTNVDPDLGWQQSLTCSQGEIRQTVAQLQDQGTEM